MCGHLTMHGQGSHETSQGHSSISLASNSNNTVWKQRWSTCFLHIPTCLLCVSENKTEGLENILSCVHVYFLWSNPLSLNGHKSDYTITFCITLWSDINESDISFLIEVNKMLPTQLSDTCTNTHTHTPNYTNGHIKVVRSAHIDTEKTTQDHTYQWVKQRVEGSLMTPVHTGENQACYETD